jgi:hypothetical protein
MAEEQSATTGHARRRSRAEAEQIVAEFQTSGLSQREFCNQHRIGLKSLSRYLTLHRRAARSERKAQRWMKVEVAAASLERSGLRVVLGNGRHIEIGPGFDGATLRELVQVLERHE